MYMLRNLTIIISGLMVVPFSFAQEQESEKNSDKAADKKDIDAPRFVTTMDSTLINFYSRFEQTETDREKLNVFDFEKEDVPKFSDSVYKERLHQLDVMTPFDFNWNKDVSSVIKMFAEKRRRFTSVTMSRSALYFPLFEKKLAQHNMPLELKHLAVIESGLMPNARSRAGATGLWQFMYRTGKMMDLDINSYVDMRKDPEKATEAACKYLKYLYKLYGDWSIALAAYNAGPGNVNKAIRRNNGAMDYWEIRSSLPRETQNYVPFFIAMTYIMNYASEHNIYPAKVKWENYEVDTVCPKQNIKLSHVDSILDLGNGDLKFLNPIFKTDLVPHNKKNQYCLTLPIEQVGSFIDKEDSIYAAFNKPLEQDSTIIVEEEKYHYVKSGENLGFIAQRYRISVRSLMRMNGMRSSRIYPGQKLVIRKKIEKAVEKEKKKKKNRAEDDSDDRAENKSKDEFYKVKRGESLWVVGNKFGTTVDDLKDLNPNINASKLKTGQKIRIR